MSPSDIAGFLAAGLVLAAFCMREMVPLRITALCSNLAFIAYGAAVGPHADLAAACTIVADELAGDLCKRCVAAPAASKTLSRLAHLVGRA